MRIAFHRSALAVVLGFLLSDCENLRYGQLDCGSLQGQAARMCQEYRQRKADADIRAEAAGLLKAYLNCLNKYQDNLETAKKNCELYTAPLRDIHITPLELK